MNNNKTGSGAIFVALAALMAATRFNHFGSAVALPDASCAVFFLGGLYLARSARLSMALFAALIVEAGLIDCYATSVQGVSDWCMTPAYWLLIPTYGSLWLAGRWAALRNTILGRAPESTRLIVLALAAWAAGSFAFVFSNAAFYLFSGYFTDMGAGEYAERVVQYYVPYVSVELLYISCAVALHTAATVIVRQRAASH
jgi:hypothetical protein